MDFSLKDDLHDVIKCHGNVMWHACTTRATKVFSNKTIFKPL